MREPNEIIHAISYDGITRTGTKSIISALCPLLLRAQCESTPKLINGVTHLTSVRHHKGTHFPEIASLLGNTPKRGV